MSVGVMKDYKLKLRKLRASHTLGTAQIPDLFTVARPAPKTPRKHKLLVSFFSPLLPEPSTSSKL